MRYFDLAGKAKIKISDNKLTIEDVKKQAVETDIVTFGDIDLIREIDREEFVGDSKKPDRKLLPVPVIEGKVLRNDYPKEDDDLSIDHLPTWQEIIDKLRIESTKPDYSPKRGKK